MSRPVTTWLAGQVPDLAPPLRWTKLAGGHSNFTYRIDDAAGRTMVARRPPLGELLPTAHDMGREFTVISALWPTDVPVPEPVAFADDTVGDRRPVLRDGLGGGSLAVHRGGDGRAHPHREPHERSPGRRSSTRSPRCTASIPTEVGLGNLGKPTDYVGRQLHRWYASWNASKNRELPDVDRLYDVPRRPPPRADPGERRPRRLRVAQLPRGHRRAHRRCRRLGDLHARRSAGRSGLLRQRLGRVTRRGARAACCRRPRCPASAVARC